MATATVPEVNRWTEDVAADLTDAALGALSAAGVRGDSVRMELALWRALTAELDQPSDTGRRSPAGVRQVVCQAARRVAAAFAPGRGGV
jgi:hypothetical protein